MCITLGARRLFCRSLLHFEMRCQRSRGKAENTACADFVALAAAKISNVNFRVDSSVAMPRGIILADTLRSLLNVCFLVAAQKAARWAPGFPFCFNDGRMFAYKPHRPARRERLFSGGPVCASSAHFAVPQTYRGKWRTTYLCGTSGKGEAEEGLTCDQKR